MSANGGKLTILGKASVSVKIRGLIIPFEFYVIRGLNHHLILGIDFLVYSKAQIDYQGQSVTFFDDLVGVNFMLVPDKVAKTMSSHVLEPRSETLINVKVNRAPDNVCFMMEGLPPKPTQKFCVARSVVIPREGTVVCRLLNPTNARVRIHRYLTIASLHEINEADISAYDDETDVNNVELKTSPNP